MAGSERVLTLVIHGTFAREEKWWRLGDDESPTFADRLEERLSEYGLRGTVWQPALDHGFSYDDFSWSGRNKHVDRVKEAKTLCQRLERLASKVGATTQDPLVVNLVAHSHGGNVVLEMLRYRPKGIKYGKVITLGTPLVVARPAARFVRFAMAIILSSLMLIIVLAIPWLLLVHAWDVYVECAHTVDIGGNDHYQCLVENDAHDTMDDVKDMLIYIPGILLWGWIVWLACILLDYLARLLISLYRVSARGLAAILRPTLHLALPRSPRNVYGPSERGLAKVLDDRNLMMVATYLDEAELLLAVGSAPGKLYREYVGHIKSGLVRLVERLLLQPFMSGIFLVGTESVLERVALGLPIWRVMLFDYEIQSREDPPYYSDRFLTPMEMNLPVEHDPLTIPITQKAPVVDDDQAPVEHDLSSTLSEMIGELKRQVQLRHSTYYGSERVVDLISRYVAGVPGTRRGISPEEAGESAEQG